MRDKNTLKTILLTVAGFLAVLVLYQSYRFYVQSNVYDRVSPGYMLSVDGADLTVVEFVDYGCPYCRQTHPIFMDAVRQDGRVNVVPRPLPYQNADASLLVYAAGEQGKFIEMHSVLISQDWTATIKNMRALSDALGISPLKLQDDFNKESMKDKVLENIRLFKKTKTSATPTFVIGKKKIFVPKDRMPTVEDFLTMFDEARAAS